MLLTTQLARRGWRIADLHRAVVRSGAAISLQAVCLWLKGGGIADRHKQAVARALEIPLGELAAAAVGSGRVEMD